MRLFGWLLMFAGAVGAIVGWNLDLIRIEAGGIEAVTSATFHYDKALTLIMAGFAFLSGAVLLGAASIEAAILKPHKSAWSSSDPQ